MSYNKVKDIPIENARILFRNFSGKEDEYNRAGNRNFCVLIDDSQQAQQLINDGWNLKPLPPREDDPDTINHYLQVSLRFDVMPPKIVLVTKRTDTPLDDDSIGTLDFADIVNVDLIIRPYNWTLHEGTAKEKSGIKAYVSTMYVTIEEDEFAEKYAR